MNRPEHSLRADVDRLSDPVEAAAWLARASLAQPLREWVIPRLVERHRGDEASACALGGRWLATLSIADDADALCEAVEQLQHQGLGPEAIQLEWLAPAAAELGRRWDEDECSFSDVTVGLVRMQCAMRRLGRNAPVVPTGADVTSMPRILLLLAPGEQHGFGLTLVAEAFRRAGWDVSCAHEAAGPTPTARLSQTPFDIVGISAGSTARADLLPALCQRLRRASCRQGIGILLGGPFFVTAEAPLSAADWGGDAIALDAREAVATALRLRAAALAADPSRLTLEAVR